MQQISCECEDCIYNDHGDCAQDYVIISNNVLTAGGFLPICTDYREKKCTGEDKWEKLSHLHF